MPEASADSTRAASEATTRQDSAVIAREDTAVIAREDSAIIARADLGIAATTATADFVLADMAGCTTFTTVPIRVDMAGRCRWPGRAAQCADRGAAPRPAA